MSVYTEPAPAKLNLTLDVLGKREDGYHDMKMIMQSVSLADAVTVTVEEGEGIALETNAGFLPTDRRNLAVAAALALQEATGADLGRITIKLEKKVPVCAGMAGGSSDAAAVLRCLNRALGLGLSLGDLAVIGARVGSDVPYCVLGGTALAEGRGELLTPLPALPQCWVVLAKPDFPISTPELFARLDGQRLRCHPDTAGAIAALEQGDLQGVVRRLFNVFEEVLPSARRRVVEELKRTLLQHGAMGACMSGTGPTVFGLFEDEEGARAAAEAAGSLCRNTFVAQTL